MSFPRGFKKDCDLISSQLRRELGTPDSQPLDMQLLGEHLAIPISAIGDHVAPSEKAHYSTLKLYARVSAVTYFVGHRRFILFNEQHSVYRHRSNLAHEFAHALLRHPPEGDNANTEIARAFEREASWLGGVLMLSTSEAHRLASQNIGVESIISHHKISHEMLAYRLQVTGAAKRFDFRPRRSIAFS